MNFKYPNPFAAFVRMALISPALLNMLMHERQWNLFEVRCHGDGHLETIGSARINAETFSFSKPVRYSHHPHHPNLAVLKRCRSFLNRLLEGGWFTRN